MDETVTPRFEYYSYLNDLFERFPFYKISPENISSSGLCLKEDDGLYMFYLPADRYAIHVHFDVPESKKVRETWFKYPSNTRRHTVIPLLERVQDTLEWIVIRFDIKSS